MTQLFEPDPKFWDGIAEKYSKQPVGDQAAFDRKIAITKGLMSPGCTVLDVGCGTGSLALFLAPEAGEVHGLDVSGEMIRIARGKAEAQGVQNATFHQGTLDQLTAFAPGSLDGICAYSLIHLVSDRAALLRRIYELLAPGGFFISSTVCLGESWVPYGVVISVMHLARKAPHVVILSKEEVNAEAEAAGFVSLEMPDVGAKKIIHFLVARKPA